MKNVIVIGAGGHAKVIADIVLKSGDNLKGFLDDKKDKGTTILDEYVVLGAVENAMDFDSEDTYFIIGIGDNYTRKKLTEKFDLKYYTAIHPTAVIGADVQIGTGSCVMPNACINPGSVIGKGCIINSAALIEHDNVLEDFVHVSPSATTCGDVKIGTLTHVGARAKIRNRVTITSEVVIGMGATVVGDILEKGTYIGTPAKKMEEK